MPAGSSSHTLASVLLRIQQGGRWSDPGLAQRLDEAFGKHEEALARYCRGELRGFPEQQVEEIVQETLLEAWNKLPAYEAKERFRAFLWGIASLKCANLRRKRRDVLPTPDDDGEALLDPGSTDRSVLERLADEERNFVIETAAQRVLDAVEQEAVQLRWVLDYPYESIADELGLADANAVRVMLQRCKRRLDAEIRRTLADRGLGESFLRRSDS